MQVVLTPSGFADWRSAARELLENGVHPREVIWQREIEESLLFSIPKPTPETPGRLKVPAAFMGIAETVGCHRSGDQWPLLYSILWRMVHGERHLLSIASDPEIHQLQTMAKHISRDCHKMHAFVRFRKVGESPGSRVDRVAPHQQQSESQSNANKNPFARKTRAEERLP